MQCGAVIGEETRLRVVFARRMPLECVARTLKLRSQGHAMMSTSQTVPNRQSAIIRLLLPAFALAIAMQPETAAAQGAPPPPTVSVETVQFSDLKGSTTFSGRVEAISKIELRARADGLITALKFEEGAEVKKGQVLFEIERRPYEIAVAQAEGNLAASQAALVAADSLYKRTLELETRQISTEASLDNAKASLAQAKARVSLDQASFEQAKLMLSYTQIAAGIDGRIGRAAHAVGDLVGPASTALATLVSQDPVYVAFAVPRPMLETLLKRQGGTYGAEVELRAGAGESAHPFKGKIAFVDVEANAATDTVVVRATVSNPGRELIPQQLVDVTIVDKEATKSLVVSQSALLLDQLGSYVLTLDSSNKVEIRRFESGPQYGSMITVRSGLAEGDRVIVGGHLRAQPGAIVTPQAAPIKTSSTSDNPVK
jgi:membrane fusion protein (multidrug efflux system)